MSSIEKKEKNLNLVTHFLLNFRCTSVSLTRERWKSPKVSASLQKVANNFINNLILKLKPFLQSRTFHFRFYIIHHTVKYIWYLSWFYIIFIKYNVLARIWDLTNFNTNWNACKQNAKKQTHILKMYNFLTFKLLKWLNRRNGLVSEVSFA